MINFDELMNLEVAESMSFEPLPEGQYKVTVDACKLGESKNGKAMYTVDFIVTEGDHASRQIRYWLVLVTKNGLHWDQVARDLVGKTATITVEIEESEYNGETRARNNITKVEWDEAKTKKKSKASKIEL